MSNSVRGPSADGAPALQRTFSDPLAASAPAGDGGEALVPVYVKKWRTLIMVPPAVRTEINADIAAFRTQLDTSILSDAINTLEEMCDGSNWPECAQQGEGFKAYTAACEIVADLTDELRTALAEFSKSAPQARTPADFETAWARRPWVDGPESDKDRARRWWNAALSASPREMGLKSDGGVEGHADFNVGRSPRASQISRELGGAGIKPGPSEPSPSSRSEPAGEWNAAIKAALNAVNDRRMREAGTFDEAHSGVKGESRSNALYDAFQDVRKLLRQAPPSPDCSGCKPPEGGVQKEDATRIEGSVTAEGANAKSGGVTDEMVRIAHAEYHKVLGDKNRSDPMRAALEAVVS